MVFNARQQAMIARGESLGFDTELFAKETFDVDQMEEIIEGLKSGVDVTIYSKPENSWKIMSVVRRGLEAKVDVSSIVANVLSYAQAEAELSRLIEEKPEEEQVTEEVIEEGEPTVEEEIPEPEVIAPEPEPISEVTSTEGTPTYPELGNVFLENKSLETLVEEDLLVDKLGKAATDVIIGQVQADGYLDSFKLSQEGIIITGVSETAREPEFLEFLPEKQEDALERSMLEQTIEFSITEPASAIEEEIDGVRLYFEEVQDLVHECTNFEITWTFHSDIIRRYCEEGKTPQEALFSLITEIDYRSK